MEHKNDKGSLILCTSEQRLWSSEFQIMRGRGAEYIGGADSLACPQGREILD